MALNVVIRSLRRYAAPQLLKKQFKTYNKTKIHFHSGKNVLEDIKIITSKLQSISTLPYSSRFYSTQTEQEKVSEDFLAEHNVTVIGQDVPNPCLDIESTDFPDYIKKYLTQQGITKPSVIQSLSWPIALSGQNFVGIAQTGTGKTLAYLLPALMHIKNKEHKKSKGPIVLIMAPTRELACQIQQVAKDFEKLMRIRCACIYGGASRNVQALILQAGVDIIIATPGRLNDFLISKTTSLGRCSYVVLDEADRMLDMGFEPQIRQALEGVPLERQILMFSATWPKEVQYLASEYLGKFVQVNVGSTELTANHDIQQFVHVCDDEEKMDKFKNLMHELAGEGFGKILVFANTKRFVDTLTMVLQRNGWPASGIHGDKTQIQRDSIIKRFKNGTTNILVATDVAARGLDVDSVTHVINYDFPNTAEDYIHRIGRTGRSGSKGTSHTLLTSENERQAQSLIDVMKEANQEVPKELEDMARSHKLLSKSQQQNNKFKKTGWTNRKWSPYQSRNRDSSINDYNTYRNSRNEYENRVRSSSYSDYNSYRSNRGDFDNQNRRNSSYNDYDNYRRSRNDRSKDSDDIYG